VLSAHILIAIDNSDTNKKRTQIKMMTRKDYVAVASIISEYRHAMTAEDYADLIADFADFFLQDNPNFSPNRFELACFDE
jgi:hypothetical protein